jgi:hypothetical protein
MTFFITKEENDSMDAISNGIHKLQDVLNMYHKILYNVYIKQVDYYNNATDSERIRNNKKQFLLMWTTIENEYDNIHKEITNKPNARKDSIIKWFIDIFNIYKILSNATIEYIDLYDTDTDNMKSYLPLFSTFFTKSCDK